MYNEYILLCFFAFIFLGYGFYKIFNILKRRKWHPVKASVLKVSEKVKVKHISEYSRVSYMAPDVKYVYMYDDKEYVGNNMIDYAGAWVPEVDAYGMPTNQDFFYWRSWDSNENIIIFVNPNNPGQSMLRNTISIKSVESYIAIVLVAFFVIFLGCFYFN